MRLSLDQIKMVDRHRQDNGDLADLIDSIADVGVLHPVVVTPDHVLVAGQRRLEAVRALGWAQVPVTVVDNIDDARARLRAERDENTCRLDMKPTEKIRLGLSLEEIERPAAKERQAATQAKLGEGKVGAGQSPAPGLTARTRELVGDAVGMSGRSYERGKQVVLAADAGDVVAQAALKEMEATGRITPAFEKLKAPRPSTNGTEPLTEHERRRGIAAKRRVETVVGTCQGYTRGLPDLKAELAARVGEADEVAGWIDCLHQAEKALKIFRKRLEGAN